jgi:phage shock protein A
MTIETAISETEALLNQAITKKQNAEKAITELTASLERFRKLQKTLINDPEFAKRVTVT